MSSLVRLLVVEVLAAGADVPEVDWAVPGERAAMEARPLAGVQMQLSWALWGALPHKNRAFLSSLVRLLVVEVVAAGAMVPEVGWVRGETDVGRARPRAGL